MIIIFHRSTAGLTCLSLSGSICVLKRMMVMMECNYSNIYAKASENQYYIVYIATIYSIYAITAKVQWDKI